MSLNRFEQADLDAKWEKMKSERSTIFIVVLLTWTLTVAAGYFMLSVISSEVPVWSVMLGAGLSAIDLTFWAKRKVFEARLKIYGY